ncbi:hypothetical protein SADUNF_Sadunf05G0171300 [Salix dunnii]|uniref:Uncharacterized protein n=1 Tax=Salix dunnii TaxID=1413687 RepID=A0A835MZM6_9ROSI|nr:hypothetical protein SADUNF_Sadunf05G0171300 [Salix dunnii]
MAKTTFVLVFSLVLLLSAFHPVFGTEDQAETVSDQMNQAASQAKETMETMSNSLGNKMKDAKEASLSWTSWFTNMMQDMGLTSGNHQLKAAAAGPEQAPAPIAAGPRGLRLG